MRNGNGYGNISIASGESCFFCFSLFLRLIVFSIGALCYYMNIHIIHASEIKLTDIL